MLTQENKEGIGAAQIAIDYTWRPHLVHVLRDPREVNKGDER